jgi:hypothetical protein
MKCISCTADIPPQWVNAIERNECPGCGSKIMDDASQDLLHELKEAMAKMPNDPAGLAGWLLSNYSLRKVGTAEPTQFHRKPVLNQDAKRQSAPNDGLKVAKNSVQDFLKRKNPGIAKSVEAQKDFAGIVNQINNGSIPDPYGNGVDLETEIDYESKSLNGEIVAEGESQYGSDIDPYEEAEYNRNNFRSKAQDLARHSLVMPGNERPLSPQETAAMFEIVSGQSNGIDPGDNLPPALQVARMERLRKQRAISEGGTDDFGQGLGSFRRH